MSNFKVPGFLKRKDNVLLFANSGYMLYYIPEDYFACKAAEIEGEYVSLMGIFNYAIFDEKGKHSGLKLFNYPTIFTCKPSSIEKLKGVKLTQNSKEDDYRVLKFVKDDEAVSCVHTVQYVSNVEHLVKIWNSGKIPNTIPVDQLHNLLNESMNLNGEDFGLTNQIFGLWVSESTRSKSDIATLYRHTNDKDKTNYQFISIKDAPKYVSPFAAITSENWDESLVAAMLNDSPKHTEMEKLIIQ